MNDSRFEFKVGLFIVVGAGLLALLILNFSKGATFGKSTYSLHVMLPNAAGLKPSADVMMSGVVIGKVVSTDLSDDGRSVNIKTTIVTRYKIHKDAQFRIDALGFLGDQYVSVSASPNSDMPYLQDGDTVNGEATFNMIEAVQSISGVVDVARATIKDLDKAITNVNNSALSAATLGHFAVAMSNLEVVSERAVSAAGRADRVLSTNEEAIHQAVLNFADLANRLTNTAGALNTIILTNAQDIHRVVTNFAQASDQFKQIADDLQAGQGPIGALLKSQEMKAQVGDMVSNASSISAELNVFASNLNQRGIWAMLWKPKHADTKHAETDNGSERLKAPHER